MAATPHGPHIPGQEPHGALGGAVNTSGCGPEDRGFDPRRAPPYNLPGVTDGEALVARWMFGGEGYPDLEARIDLVIGQLLGRVSWAQGERNELRAILAPQLDDPYDNYDAMEWWCRFCGVQCDPYQTAVHCDHKPGCPVLDRDRLLGRQP